MQISARYQAVFEILREVFKDEMPADNIISDYVRQRKYIGSKDRRFIINLVWNVIRRRMRLTFEAGCSDVRKILLLYLKDEDFDIVADGSPYGLACVTREEKLWLKGLKEVVYPEHVGCECPKWLFDKIANTGLVKSLQNTAPADLRVNMADRMAVKLRLQNEGLFFSETPYSPFGLRSEERVNLNNCAAYQEGLVEVQDESCQIATVLCDVRPEEKVVDYCAGAGGKSLALAAINRNEGEIHAHDLNWNRMDAIKNRAMRLGIRNIKLIRGLDDSDYDCFIIDAPCSGSGTWRRAPDAKFRLSPEKLSHLVQTQMQILQTGFEHIKPGGRLVYMTCSVLPDENEQIVSRFVENNKNASFADHQHLWLKKFDMPYPFNERRFIKFSPHTTNTDGFFFCVINKY